MGRRTVQRVGERIIVVIPREEWQGFLAEYDAEDLACHDTTIGLLYADLGKFARSRTPVELEPHSPGYAKVVDAVLSRRHVRGKGYQIEFHRDGFTGLFSTMEPDLVVCVGQE